MTISGGIFAINQVYNKNVSKTWAILAPDVQNVFSDITTVNEGGVITVSVNTADYSEGDTLYWTIEGVSGTINSSDFNSLSGSFTIQANNFAFFSVEPTADLTTEGTETFVLKIRSSSTSGTVLATTNLLTINDTSRQEYGWFAGGASQPGSILSRIDRVDFSSDTGTASVRGNLNGNNSEGAGLGNDNYGYFMGRYSTRISRIQFITDTNTAIDRGTLTTFKVSSSGTSTQTYGWYGGGLNPSLPSPNGVSTVERINFASDTDTNLVRGPLTLARAYLTASSNDTYGWFYSGYNFPSYYSRVDRITFDSDTDTASTRTNIESLRSGAAVGDNDYGWYGGGYFSPSLANSNLKRITYASDTSGYLSRGNLTSEKGGLTATGNDSFGWFGGGNILTPSIRSDVDRITYSNDTITASARGKLSLARHVLASTSGTS